MITSIVKYRMHFKSSALSMIRRKYLDLDLSGVDLSLMEGYNVLNPNDEPTEVQESGPEVDADQDVVIDGDNPQTLKAQVFPEPNVVNPINVSPDVKNDN